MEIVCTVYGVQFKTHLIVSFRNRANLDGIHIIKKKFRDIFSEFIGFRDSRIQINLFAKTNTFCYGINKQDMNYKLQDKSLIIKTNI